MRQIREFMYEGIAAGTLGNIAAVDENIAARVQRLADGIEFRIKCLQRCGVVDGATQMQLACLAVRDDVDGIEAAAALQEIGDLVETILAGIEHDDLGIGGDSLFDGGGIFDIGIDEDDGLGGGIALDHHGAIHMRAEACDFESAKPALSRNASARFGRVCIGGGGGTVVLIEGMRIDMQGLDGGCDGRSIEHDARLQPSQQRFGPEAGKCARLFEDRLGRRSGNRL